MPSRSLTLSAVVEQAFSDHGALSQLFPNYRANPAQKAYAFQVADVLMQGSASRVSVGLLEAGTGIGKTLGYAIPLLGHAALTGCRVAISTHSVQLQSQLMRESGDLATAARVVKAVTGTDLTLALRVGVANFVNLQRLDAALAKLGIRDSDMPADIQRFVGWARASQTKLISEWFGRYGELPAGIALSEIGCRYQDTGPGIEAYQRHKDLAGKADVVVTNHSLLFLQAIDKSRSILDMPDGRQIKIIVADEADRLEQAAQLISYQSSSLNRLFNTLDEQAGSHLRTAIGGLLDTCEAAYDDLPPGNTLHLNLNEHPKIASQVSANLSEAISHLDRYLQTPADPALSDKHAELAISHGLLRQFMGALARPGAIGGRIPIVHYSGHHRLPSLVLFDPHGSMALGNLWKPGDNGQYANAVLLTSATLSAGDTESLKRAGNLLGLIKNPNALVTTGIFEPDEFGAMSFVVPAPNAPPPSVKDDDDYSTSLDWINYLAGMVTEAAGDNGRVLVLMLSYADTELLANSLLDRLPRMASRLLVHRKGVPLSDMLARYSVADDGILLSPGCWEGVNLPGLVPNLVISRCPFPPQDTLFADIIRQNMLRKGFSAKAARNVLFASSVTDARRRLRQGLGRGIRQHADRCTVWIGDVRLVHGKLISLATCVPTRFVSNVPVARVFGQEDETTSKPALPWGKRRYFGR